SRLWQTGSTFNDHTDGTPRSDMADGLDLSVINQPNADTWCVKLSFRNSARTPDVGLASWRQPPGESYESTDIWIDSPLNGYGTFRYGMWNDLDNQSVPRGNGDDPAIGSINRVYARIHNYGLRAATNVKVQLQVSNPLGVGIPRTNGWRDLGAQLTAAQFPALASIPAQGYTDVYVDWAPDVTLTPAQIAAGVFQLHSCVRVVVSPVDGETMLGNQDGSEEQENIQNFEATPTRSPTFTHTLTLTNDTLNNTIVYLNQANTLPVSWTLTINNNDRDIAIPAMTGSTPISVTVPITVTAAGSSVVGSSFVVKINALENRELINQSSLITEPTYLRTHPDRKNIGGFNFTVNVLADTQIQCTAYGWGGSYVEVVGALDGFEGIHQAGVPLRAYAQLYDDTYAPIALDDRAMGAVGSNGVFRMSFNSIINQKAKFPKYVRCLFPGTTMLASSASGYVEITPTLVPTSTPEAWADSQFHAALSLNQFLPPRESYGDQIDIFASTANPYICTAGRCPQLSGGVHGRSVQFSPANDTFLQSTNTVSLANAFSVGLWVKRDLKDINEWLISHGNNTTRGNLFALGFNANNQVVCSTFGDEFVSTKVINDSTWHHVACVVDGNQRRISIDGVLDASDDNRLTGPYASTAKFQIARRPDTHNSFAGNIDEVNIYDYAISDITIAKLYSQPQSSIPPQLPFSHLTFDDVSITQGLVTIGCSGAGCPVVSYPNRSVVPRLIERLASFKMQPLRGLTVRSTASIASGSDSTLQFWSYFALPSRTEALVTQLQANRPSISVSSSEINYAGIRYSYQINRFPPNQWHHYAFVKSGTQLLMYIDGNQVASGTAAASLLPFRVGTGSTLYAGMMATPNGELAALELTNQALGADAIVQRYMQGVPSANIMPTATATMSLTPSVTQTPGQTYTPSRTIAVAMASKTAVALTNTSIKVVSQTAAPKATQSRVAQLDLTNVASTVTRWADYSRTDVAIRTRSLVATKIPLIVYPTRIPSLVILADTRTATYTITPNYKFSPTSTTTPNITRTPSQTATVTLTASNTAVAVASRTAKVTMTDVASPTFAATTATTTASPKVTITKTEIPALVTVERVSINTLPPGMLYRAMQHIYDTRAMAAGDWDTTYISPQAVPFYRPDIGQGKVPAYYEIAIFSDSARTKPAGYLLLTNPTSANPGVGQIDFPVAHWDSRGEAVSTLLVKNAKPKSTSSVKVWKLDALSYLMVQDNSVISTLGDIPPVMVGLDQTTFDTYATGNNALSELKWSPNNNADPDNLYKYSGGVVTTKGPQAKDVEGMITYNTEINPLTDFASYQAVYAETFAPLIKNLRERTIRHWNLEGRINPTAGVFNVVAAAETTTTIVIPFAGMTTKNIVISDPNAMISSMTAGNTTVGGFPTFKFTIRARSGDEASRAIVYVIDGQQILGKWYLYMYPHEVTVVAPVSSNNRSHNWSGWSFFDAGTADDQREYNQFTYGTTFSAVGAACLSGCGATAWMMLFGWADYKSSIPGSGVNRYYTYREGGTQYGSGTSVNGVAPKLMNIGTAVNPGLRNAILFIRGRISSVCQVTGASSTLPADMDNARYYLSYVGTGLGIDVSYHVFFYPADRIKNNTRAEIAYNHRPVVVGTGFGSHYPLAYRYAWRSRPEHWNEGIADGDDVVYSEFFYVNNGWGQGGLGGWTDAGVWYSGRLIHP
ncbi:MAG: LamG domain-containing protein, partial [Chloroflexales bacterium]|nr:LamG domain-containing protein [Chloroflexales bacterium]